MKILGVNFGKKEQKKPLSAIGNKRGQNIVSAANWGGDWVEPFVEIGVRGGSQQSGSPRVTGTVTPTSVGMGMEPRNISNADYDKLYKLSSEHHDVSFAITNIVELGGTGQSNITFDPTVKPKEAAKMLLEIRNAAKIWYDGGEPMLINALLRQAAITGCVSGEAKPLTNLKGVGNVTLLSPKWVYFQYDAATADYKPFQQTIYGANGLDNAIIRWSTYNAGYHALSLKTYKYIALSRDEDSPYGIPPILAALMAVCIENDMLENMSAITRRLGLMGFLQVIVNAPQRAKNSDGTPEADSAYQQRIQQYLASLEPEIEKGLSNGFVLSAKQISKEGVEMKTDFEMTSSTADTAGAAALIELIMRVTAAGLKQDPIMLGKNFSTTESLANVVIKKFAAQLVDYQRAVAQFLEHCYTLHLRLMGFKFQWLNVSFEPPMLESALNQYTGLSAKFDYYKSLFNQGIISQSQLANHMGFEAPFMDKPPVMIEVPTNIVPVTITPTPAVSSNSFIREKSEAMSLSTMSESQFLKFSRSYNRDTTQNFKNAIAFVSEQLCHVVSLMHPLTPLDNIVAAAKNSVLLNWHTAFTRYQAETSKYWISEAYKFFRADKAIFRGKRKYRDEFIADGDFNNLDRLFQRHFYTIDFENFGMFATDVMMPVIEDVIKKMYETNTLPLIGKVENIVPLRGNITSELERKMPDLVTITNTTMSNVRVIAGLMYLQQNGVEELELVGNSAVVCDNCSAGEVAYTTNCFERFLSMVEAESRDVKMPPAYLLGFEKNANYTASICCKCKILAKF